MYVHKLLSWWNGLDVLCSMDWVYIVKHCCCNNLPPILSLITLSIESAPVKWWFWFSQTQSRVIYNALLSYFGHDTIFLFVQHSYNFAMRLKYLCSSVTYNVCLFWLQQNSKLHLIGYLQFVKCYARYNGILFRNKSTSFHSHGFHSFSFCALIYLKRCLFKQPSASLLSPANSVEKLA